VQLTWFRNPGPDHPGALNLCYNALDVHVIRGSAELPALVTPDGIRDFAKLLEQVATLAGALRMLDVKPGDHVAIGLDDPADEVLTMLACARVGAVHGSDQGGTDHALLVTSRATSRAQDGPRVRARLLRGVAVVDPERDVDWDVAVKAGRANPAPCEAVSPDAPAFVVGAEVVRVRDAVGHDSWAGRCLADLCAGLPVDVTRR
jgi:acyl-coenzyme A synthetase/AMP-(fatty) acid ligase